MDRFNHLIRLGESQRSNGSVRKVERPDGETRFAVAYGEEPDHDLRIILVCHLNVSIVFGCVSNFCRFKIDFDF